MVATQPSTVPIGPIENHAPKFTLDEMIRLQQRAGAENIRILLSRDGATFATSGSDPNKIYAVSLGGCECEAFTYRRQCKHIAALVAYYNQPPARPRYSVATS